MTSEHRLIITEGDYQRLARHVGVTADERMAFLYCGRTSSGTRTDWLVREIDLPDDAEYRRQSFGRVTLKAEAAVGRVLRARQHAGFGDVHSHPFTDQPYPSGTDQHGVRDQLRVLGDLAPNAVLLRMIAGARGALFAEVFDADANAMVPLSEVVILGRGRRQVLRPVNATEATARTVEALDTRTAAVLGEAARALRSMRVLVIGAGGVGSAVLSQIAGLVDQVDIVDPDDIEAHNLPRLLQAGESDVGHPKADVVAGAMTRRFARLVARPHAGRFPDGRSEELFRAADFVFCCPDHHAVRWAAASLAARTMRPLVEVGCGGRRGSDGAITALGYHVRFQVPGGPCLACNGLDLSRLEDPASTQTKVAAGYIEGDGAVQGELVTLTARAAADAVDVFVRYATGYAGAARGHIYFDALNFTSLDLTGAYAPDPACSLCGDGEHSVRAAGDELNEEQRVLPPPQEVADAAV